MPQDCPPSDLAEQQQPLLDISIHPTKLRHLAEIPQQLPINSLIFHFSDGSIRATLQFSVCWVIKMDLMPMNT
jgi:hypothetical protein